MRDFDMPPEPASFERDLIAQNDRSPSFNERLWSKIVRETASECWQWVGSRNQFGHGSLRAGGRGSPLVRAHRAVWEATNGQIPEGMYVCHRCDNPGCCNPSHLFLGTTRDNTQDMISKGRNSPPPLHLGESHPRSTLTEDKVRAIRRAMPLPLGGRKRLAEQLGVSLKNVSDVVHNKAWRHVDAY